MSKAIRCWFPAASTIIRRIASKSWRLSPGSKKDGSENGSRYSKRPARRSDCLAIFVIQHGRLAFLFFAHLTFGLEIVDSDSSEEVIMEEVRLVMTPRTLKTVQMTLTNLVQGLQRDVGMLEVINRSTDDERKQHPGCVHQ